MPTAICPSCGTTIRWQNKRGSSLAALRCPRCGGSVESAEYDSAKSVWTRRKHRPQKRGGVVYCGLCGVGRRCKGPLVHYPTEPETYQVVHGGFLHRTTTTVTIDVGIPICSYHRMGHFIYLPSGQTPGPSVLLQQEKDSKQEGTPG